MTCVTAAVVAICQEAYGTCYATLAGNRETLDKLAARLIEVETVDGEDFTRIMEGKQPLGRLRPPAQIEVKVAIEDDATEAVTASSKVSPRPRRPEADAAARKAKAERKAKKDWQDWQDMMEGGCFDH
jgi:hypothetical protein